MNHLGVVFGDAFGLFWGFWLDFWRVGPRQAMTCPRCDAAEREARTSLGYAEA